MEFLESKPTYGIQDIEIAIKLLQESLQESETDIGSYLDGGGVLVEYKDQDFYIEAEREPVTSKATYEVFDECDERVYGIVGVDPATAAGKIIEELEAEKIKRA